jgi:hypothetical protein
MIKLPEAAVLIILNVLNFFRLEKKHGPRISRNNPIKRTLAATRTSMSTLYRLMRGQVQGQGSHKGEGKKTGHLKKIGESQPSNPRKDCSI